MIVTGNGKFIYEWHSLRAGCAFFKPGESPHARNCLRTAKFSEILEHCVTQLSSSQKLLSPSLIASLWGLVLINRHARMRSMYEVGHWYPSVSFAYFQTCFVYELKRCHFRRTCIICKERQCGREKHQEHASQSHRTAEVYFAMIQDVYYADGIWRCHRCLAVSHDLIRFISDRRHVERSVKILQKRSLLEPSSHPMVRACILCGKQYPESWSPEKALRPSPWCSGFER